jgi:hypothetical protein
VTLALLLHAGWLLWHSRRERLAAAIPAQEATERAAVLALTIAVAGVVLALLARSPAYGLAALPACAALIAWSFRHAPRCGAGFAILGVVAGVASRLY